MKIKKAMELVREQLLALRLELFPVQKDYANVLGIDVSDYSKLEKYATDIKMSKFFWMCRKLKVQPWDLLRFALEHHLDFTEEEGKEWGE